MPKLTRGNKKRLKSERSCALPNKSTTMPAPRQGFHLRTPMMRALIGKETETHIAIAMPLMVLMVATKV